jgi:DNA-binding GntR family transcriptional regulator
MRDTQIKKSDNIRQGKGSVSKADNTQMLAATPEATPTRLRRVIIDGIATGDLLPGARLKETELVARLLVSRTPLREALAALRAEGILERDEDGLRVRRLDWHDVRALYELRGTLEGLAASLAAQNAGDAERAVIDDICGTEARLVRQGAAPDILARHNRQFHHAILQAAGNRFLAESLERLSRLMVLLGATAYSLAGRVEPIRDEHDAINRAIQDGDAAGAAAAMSYHLDSALTARLKLLSMTAGQELD